MERGNPPSPRGLWDMALLSFYPVGWGKSLYNMTLNPLETFRVVIC